MRASFCPSAAVGLLSAHNRAAATSALPLMRMRIWQRRTELLQGLRAAAGPPRVVQSVVLKPGSQVAFLHILFPSLKSKLLFQNYLQINAWHKVCGCRRPKTFTCCVTCLKTVAADKWLNETTEVVGDVKRIHASLNKYRGYKDIVCNISALICQQDPCCLRCYVLTWSQMFPTMFRPRDVVVMVANNW